MRRTELLSSAFLLLAAFLPTGPLCSQSAIIVLKPGETRVLKRKEKIITGVKGTPRIGDKKRETTIDGVSVQPVSAEPAAPPEPGAVPGSDVVRAATAKGAIRLYAPAAAAGKVFTLTVNTKSRVWEYREIVATDLDGKIQKAKTWTEVGPESGSDSATVFVEIGDLPTVLAPVGGETTIALPPSVAEVTIKRASSKYVDVQVTPDNRIHVRGKEAGKPKFTVEYSFQGKGLKSTMPVQVLAKEFTLNVLIEDRAKPSTVLAARIDDLLPAESGRIVRVDNVEKADVATVEVAAGAVRILGLTPGRTKATITYEGSEKKRRKPGRYLAQITLDIEVK